MLTNTEMPPCYTFQQEELYEKCLHCGSNLQLQDFLGYMDAIWNESKCRQGSEGVREWVGVGEYLPLLHEVMSAIWAVKILLMFCYCHCALEQTCTHAALQGDEPATGICAQSKQISVQNNVNTSTAIKLALQLDILYTTSSRSSLQGSCNVLLLICYRFHSNYL